MSRERRNGKWFIFISRIKWIFVGVNSRWRYDMAAIINSCTRQTHNTRIYVFYALLFLLFSNFFIYSLFSRKWKNIEAINTQAKMLHWLVIKMCSWKFSVCSCAFAMCSTARCSVSPRFVSSLIVWGSCRIDTSHHFRVDVLCSQLTIIHPSQKQFVCAIGFVCLNNIYIIDVYLQMCSRIYNIHHYIFYIWLFILNRLLKTVLVRDLLCAIVYWSPLLLLQSVWMYLFFIYTYMHDILTKTLLFRGSGLGIPAVEDRFWVSPNKISE